MKIIRLIIPSIIFINIACKSPQKTAEATLPPLEKSEVKNVAITDNKDIPLNENADLSMQISKDPPYRFIISFISIGEGTDRNAKEILDAALNNWKTSQKKDINYEEVHWGREGEVDFCFLLTELKEVDQKKFISEMKEKFNGHALVQFAENEPCLHKR